MATVDLKDVRKIYAGGVEAVKGVIDRHSRRRALRAGRPVGLRQVHAAAHDRRAGDDHRRHRVDRRQGGQRDRADRARHRHGVPELRALSAYEGLRQHGLRPAQPRHAEGRDRPARRGRRRKTLELGALLDRQPARAVRRPAPARRHGPRHRAQPEGVPVRRAALQPRRQAARPDAGRDQEPAARARRHQRLRHPRPARGDDARRPAGGDECRHGRAGRRAARDLREAGLDLRRGLHRRAADEPSCP